MDWIDTAEIMTLAGFILFFVSLWRRTRIGWNVTRAVNFQTAESAGELCGFIIGWLGVALLTGNQIVEAVQRGAPPKSLAVVACVSAIFMSGVSFGRLTMRQPRRLSDSAATPHGEVCES
jgi:hypothetical protein